MKTISNKHHPSLPNQTRKRGGRTIGSGGYGCVFRPALACKNKKTRKKHMVSKLLRTKHGKKEMSIIKKLRKIVQRIPNYTQYFLVKDASLCKPAKLTDADLEGYDDKCNALEKHDHITKANINNHLSKLVSINLPDGGVTLASYYDYMTNEENFNYINYDLIDLFKNGILPMNKLGMYHGDVKDSNILYSSETKHVALIDWGLSFSYKKGRVPDIVRGRPFQYNLPFSLVLFTKTFDKMYNDAFRTSALNYASVSSFVKKYIKAWNKERGVGHISTIDDIWGLFTKSSVTNQIIVPYLTNVILAFGDTDVFRAQEYFEKVYVKIIDVWGLLMSYTLILENNTFRKREGLYALYRTYLLGDPTRPIDMSNMIRDLYNL